MPNLPCFLAHFDQNYKIFATKVRFRIRRVVLERVNNNNNNNNNIAKQEHDHVKGSKLTCFCIDKLVSSSDRPVMFC